LRIFSQKLKKNIDLYGKRAILENYNIKIPHKTLFDIMNKIGDDKEYGLMRSLIGRTINMCKTYKIMMIQKLNTKYYPKQVNKKNKRKILEINSMSIFSEYIQAGLHYIRTQDMEE
jgi:hypothetical protein